MTNPPDTEPTLDLVPRTSYLELVPLQEQTLARAQDVNQIQTNVDAALRLFAGDVSITLQDMLRAMTYRIMALERRQAAFEVKIENDFAAYRAEVDAEFTQLRTEVDTQIRELSQWVNDKLGEMRAYLDVKLVENLNAAKAYTDTRELRLLRLMWDSTLSGLVFDTPILGDGGNYAGGKGWDFVVGTVPNGMALYVYGWEFDWTTTADSGGAADDVQVMWPNFLGQRRYADGANHHEELRSEKPLFGIYGPYSIQAGFYINNIKGRGRFSIRGRMVPYALEQVAKEKGWEMPDTFIGNILPGPGSVGTGGDSPITAVIVPSLYAIGFANLNKGDLDGQSGWHVADGAFVITTNGLEMNAPVSAGAYFGAGHDMPTGTETVQLGISAGQPMLRFFHDPETDVCYAAWFTDAGTVEFGVRTKDQITKASGTPLTITPPSGDITVSLTYAAGKLTCSVNRAGWGASGEMTVDPIPGGKLIGLNGSSAIVFNLMVF